MNSELRARVGAVLQAQRAAQGLSLSELARVSGVAKATLSALEAGTANPTLDTLWSLASALHLSLSELVEAPAENVQVVRAPAGTLVKGTSVAARLFSTFESGASRFELFDASAKMKRQVSPAHDRGVSEHLFVTAGKLRVGPLNATVELEPGDYLHMKPAWPHLYEALARETRFFLIMQYSR
jgi:transcriptional regulator with XRE-family HTH domain